jgi:hypothetical protein
MNTTLLRMARKHFNSDLVPAYINKSNRKKWVRMIRILGPKWQAIQGRKEAQQ